MSSEGEKKTTWSVKLDATVRQEVMELCRKSGERPNDFMSRLLSAYKLHKAVEAVPIARQEVIDLTTHFAGIEAIFGGLLERMSAAIMAKEQESKLIIEELTADRQAENAQQEEISRALREQVSSLQAELKSREAMRERAIRERDEQKELADAQAESLRLAQELAAQYQTTAKAYQERAGEAEALRDELAAAREEAARAKAELMEKDTLHRQEILELRERHQDAIERIRTNRAPAKKKEVS